MEEKQILLNKFSDGSLSVTEQFRLEELISKGEIELDELDIYDQVVSYFESSEETDFSHSSDVRFYTMLEGQKARKRVSWSFSQWFTPPVRVALGVFGVVVVFMAGMSFGAGQKTDSSVVEEGDLATAILTTNNVSDRIHLVSSTDMADEADEKIIKALLYTINTDESTNVRLACIDVLMQYSYLPVVREGLINSISHQTSPLVLTNLAEAINASGKSLEKVEFKEKINKDLPPPVRNSLEENLFLI